MEATLIKPVPVPKEVKVIMSIEEAVLIRNIMAGINGNNDEVLSIYRALYDLDMPAANIDIRRDLNQVGVWGKVELINE